MDLTLGCTKVQVTMNITQLIRYCHCIMIPTTRQSIVTEEHGQLYTAVDRSPFKKVKQARLLIIGIPVRYGSRTAPLTHDVPLAFSQEKPRQALQMALPYLVTILGTCNRLSLTKFVTPLMTLYYRQLMTLIPLQSTVTVRFILSSQEELRKALLLRNRRRIIRR